MLAFLGYTIAVLIFLAIVPTSIALGVYAFKKVPSALEFFKGKINNRKRDSLDIDIEDKQKDIQWLREKKEKIAVLKSLEEEERLLKEEIDRESERLEENLLIDERNW